MSAPSEPVFDKAEADALLPRLEPLLRDLQGAVLSDAMAGMQEHAAHGGRSNGAARAAASASRSAARIHAILEEIAEFGVILRDVATGLCDFPALREGRPVYLCWRLGEGEVGWWHPRDAGVAGRRPL